MNLGIVGSRTFADYELFKYHLVNLIDITRLTGIVSGGADGADSLAKRFATENNIPFIEHVPNWNEFDKAAGPIRNSLIIRDSNILLAYWNLSSRGTKDSINKALKKGIPVIIVPVEEIKE